MSGSSLSIFSWGANSYGQLGQGHKDDLLEPRAVTPLLHKVNFITGGGGHTLALSENGTLLSCGLNDKGQAGQGQKDDKLTLTPVNDLESKKFVKVVGGWDFSLALTEDGCLLSWGSNAFGQLRRSTAGKYEHTAMPVALPEGEKIVDMSAGLRHGLALSASGRIFAWGQGRKGQLGVTLDSKVSKCETPVEVKISGSCPKHAVCGSYHSAVLTDSGEIYIWGDNKFGQLTLPPDSVKHQSEPQRIGADMFGDRRVVSLHSGWTHLVACTDDGSVWTWGRGDYGQLGRSCDQSHDFTPRPIENLKNVQVACGSEHTLAIDGSGALWSWGWNEHGMCATGDEVNVSFPHKVAALRDYKVSHIGCGAGHCFAVT